jgi:hypothetical protein
VLAKSIEGAARSVEALQPSVIGTFFGNVAYLFLLDVGDGNAEKLPNGTVTKTVSVRLDGFARIPNFDGRLTRVYGTFDKTDNLFIAQSLSVIETGISVKAARRLGLGWAVSAILLYYAIVFVIALVTSVASGSIVGRNYLGDPQINYFLVVITLALIALFLVFSLVGFVYLGRCAFPSIYEAYDKRLRAFTEDN